MRTTLLPACALAALVTTGAAQTPMKLDGKLDCAKPEPNHVVPVADTAKHALLLGAVKCTWSKGTLGGERLKDEEDTFMSDATGNSSHDRGYAVGSVQSGDRYFVHFKGTTTLKDGAPVSADCDWKFTGGTGKLKGITGKGTCKGTFQADGSAAWQLKGEYKLAAPARN
jgi:hypothetical protein